ncbi:MAG: hypothetical protein HQ583_04470, partial [Candidatus Abyssubacteria bacterium]|nr:hypothetical protein [Candidatus Abyssubacteria bacterium]
MRPCSPYWENIERFMAVTLVLLIILGSPIAAAADDGEGDWKEFVLDASADSWKMKGETAVDLRSGRHVTSAFCRIHSGDFIKWSGWNPSWVTLITMDRGKILFSNDGTGDSKVDETAERVPNCVPIHHGNSYVASFDGRTYTIKLVEGHYEFGASYARFLYRPGGTPGPEHEPRKRIGDREIGPESQSSSSAEVEMDPSKGHFRMRIKESDSINFFGTSEPASRLDSSEEDRIDTVTVIVKTPPPEDGESPKSYSLSLSLNAGYEGGFTSMNRDFLA